MGVGRQFLILPLYPVLSGRLLRRGGEGTHKGCLIYFSCSHLQFKISLSKTLQQIAILLATGLEEQRGQDPRDPGPFARLLLEW